LCLAVEPQARRDSLHNCHCTVLPYCWPLLCGGRILLERRELIGEGFPEWRPRFAALAIRGEIGELVQCVCVAQNAQHSTHHQVARGEPVLEIVARSQPL